MINKLSKIVMMAGTLLPLVLTFSCSSGSDDPPSKADTYFYSWHGMKNCSYESLLETISSRYTADPSFEGKRNIWSYIKSLNGDFLGSNNGLTESSLRNELLQRAASPTEVDGLVETLKTKGNAILTFYTNDPRYCMEIWYLERNSWGNGSSGTNNLCGGVSYDPSTYRCELGELIGKCRGKDYYVAYERCVDGVIVDNNSNNNSSSSSSSQPPKSSSSVKISSSSSKSSSSSNATSVNVDCDGYCRWDDTGCVRISTDPTGKYGGPITTTCAAAISNCQSGSPSKQVYSNSTCSTEDIGTPSSSSQTIVVYGTPVTYEGETYETIVIGEQTWFQRNLNYAVAGSKCYDDCTTYGRLYDWATAMALPSSCNSSGLLTGNCPYTISTKHKGICPSGWHIPSDTDWYALMKFVSPSCYNHSDCDNGGIKLKAISGWKDGGNGQDKYGFSALPGGYVVGNYAIDNIGYVGYWWSTYSKDNGASSFVINNSKYLYTDVGKSYLYSVRCLQD